VGPLRPGLVRNHCAISSPARQTNPMPLNTEKNGLMLPLWAATVRGRVTGGGAAAGSGATVVEVDVVVEAAVMVVEAATRGRVDTVALVVGVVSTEDDDGGEVTTGVVVTGGTKMVVLTVVAAASPGESWGWAPAGHMTGASISPRDKARSNPTVARTAALAMAASLSCGLVGMDGDLPASGQYPETVAAAGARHHLNRPGAGYPGHQAGRAPGGWVGPRVPHPDLTGGRP
jgi:hypothetical protein